eukprot:3501079-Alexandrium_andersonii.AAC.1
MRPTPSPRLRSSVPSLSELLPTAFGLLCATSNLRHISRSTSILSSPSTQKQQLRSGWKTLQPSALRWTLRSASTTLAA